MTQDQPEAGQGQDGQQNEEENASEQAAQSEKTSKQKINACGGTWWIQGFLRVFATVGGIAAFGLLVWAVLFIEIQVMNLADLLPQESILKKALVLAVLLVPVLIVLLGVPNLAHRRWLSGATRSQS